MALTQDAPRDYFEGTLQNHPVAAGVRIFTGAAIGADGSNDARPLVAADPFLGFAELAVDNTGGAAGDREVRCKQDGTIALVVAGATAPGDPVYASDDGTFTTTSAGNSFVGRVTSIRGADAIVAFSAAVAA